MKKIWVLINGFKYIGKNGVEVTDAEKAVYFSTETKAQDHAIILRLSKEWAIKSISVEDIGGEHTTEDFVVINKIENQRDSVGIYGEYLEENFSGYVYRGKFTLLSGGYVMPDELALAKLILNDEKIKGW